MLQNLHQANQQLGQYLKRGNDMATALTDAGRELSKKGSQAAGRTRAEQLNMFAGVAFEKHPDIAPPKPVMQDVGAAAFMDALGILSNVAGLGSGMQGWKEFLKP